MLQSSATPFNLQTQGRIYVTRINAGESWSIPFPILSA